MASSWVTSERVPSLAGMGQTTLGGAGLTLGSLVAPQAAAPALSMGLGGVDFSTSSEKKNDKSSGANPQ